MRHIKYATIGLILMLAALGLTGALAHAQGSEVEPNNTCATAQNLGAVTLPFFIRGSIDSRVGYRDLDFFRFTGTPGSQLLPDLEGAATGQGTLTNPWLSQYDSACNIIDYLWTPNARFTPLTVPPDGVVILDIEHSTDDEFGKGSYLLTISRLAYAGTISGRLIDARTGAALPGWAELRWCGAAPDSSCSAPMTRVDAGTDGRFSFNQIPYFPQIPAGRYAVIVGRDGYGTAGSAPFVIGAGQNKDVGDIPLGRPCPICTMTHAAALPALDGSPSEWDGFPMDVLDRDSAATINGPPPEHADALATLQWAWDPSGLYLAVHVRDDALVHDSTDPAQDDVFELAVEGGGSSHVYRITQDGRQSDRGTTIQNLTVFARTVPAGYDLEIFIPAGHLNIGALQPGREFRFTWGIGDDDNGGSADVRLIAYGTRLDAFEPAWPVVALGESTRTFTGLAEAGRWELFGRGALNDAFFVDSSYGWAAGTGVWKTTDGGTTWRRIPVLAGATLRRIVFADRTRGWALGHDNRILRTEDGGETWQPALGGDNLDGPPVLEFQAPDDLWIGGNHQMEGTSDWTQWGYSTHSTDGGLTWTQDTLYGYIETLDFFDQAHVWVEAESDPCTHLLARTLDAGETWTYTCLPVTSRDVTVAAIAFGSPTHGWLAADAALWRSTDGGATWAEQRTFPSNLSWIQAQDATRAWVQHDASLWRTTDGGATWQLLTEAAPARVSFRTSLEGWGTDGSAISKTTDGGRTWRAVFTQTAARSAEWFWDALTGWRPNSSHIERTTDGGATWRGAVTGLQGIDAFQFVDARNGWAWHNASLGLAHSTDGGATWRVQDTGSAALTDLQFVDARHGWVRNGEQVRGTADGGQSWHALPSLPLIPPPSPNIQREVNQLMFIDATRGWAAITEEDFNGSFFYYSSWLTHTTDGGNSWGPLESVPVDRVTFLDRDHGFGWYRHTGGGAYGYLEWAISGSDDGGRTWRELKGGEASGFSDYGPRDLYAADLERLWSPGMAPFVGYSSDGGLTWTDQRAEGPPNWAGAWFDRTGRAFARTQAALLWYRATEVTAYRAARPPQIDGNLADWAGVPAYLLNADRAYRALWATPTPLDASATLQAAWDANNLYFALRVYDDVVKIDSGAKPWQDDAVEIGLDGRHDHVRNYALDDDRQFTVTALGQIYESGNLLTDVPVARANTSNGYILEFASPKARLGELGLGAQALPGLNWTLIDDDDGGNADSKLEWTGAEANAANGSWGQLRLSALELTFNAAGTETATPTPTATSSATQTQTPTASATPTLIATATSTLTPTAAPTATPTPTPTATPTATPSSTPTASRTPAASATPLPRLYLPLVLQ